MVYVHILFTFLFSHFDTYPSHVLCKLSNLGQFHLKVFGIEKDKEKERKRERLKERDMAKEREIGKRVSRDRKVRVSRDRKVRVSRDRKVS